MSFRREQIKDYFLMDTNIENMFINEYMATAPGDFVKVYLFAQMYAGLGSDITNDEIAKYLSLDPEDVLKAWTYWERMGVIRKTAVDPDNRLDYDVEFVNLKEQLYGDRDSASARSYGLDERTKSAIASEDVHRMFGKIEQIVGKVMGATEMQEILSWVDDFRLSPDVIIYGFNYCYKMGKKNIKYISAVLQKWSEEGLTDIESIEKHLSENDRKQHMYRRVFKALGFSRNATEEEKKIMDTWFETMEFSMEKVVEACNKTSGISNPNINYVNKVLVNWYEKSNHKTPAGNRKELKTSEIMSYYDTLRRMEESEAEEHRREVYSKVPRIKEIDSELMRNNRELSRVIISDTVDRKEVAERIKKKTEDMNTEKAFLLTDNGFELDYMDIRYTCPKCKDTGMLETGERCQCFGEVSREKIEMISRKNSR